MGGETFGAKFHVMNLPLTFIHIQFVNATPGNYTFFKLDAHFYPDPLFKRLPIRRGFVLNTHTFAVTVLQVSFALHWEHYFAVVL